jgi:fumarate reductase flavoprotein subunit
LSLARQRRETATGRATLLIAGAGMAGLVAAARARELGAAPLVFEKGDRAGGSMLLSSGVIWRHRTLDEFRAECPDGDPALQARIVDELDGALDWLERLGIEPVRRETGNPLTLGRRYDTRALTDVLVRAAGDVRLRQPFHEAQVLATGGFAARLARERGLLLRAAPWSEGDGLAFALERGAGQTAGIDQYYGRALPAPVPEDEYVSASQLYARRALVLDDEGRDLGAAAWHESDIVQRFPDGKAWYVVDARALREPVRQRTVADLVEAARAAGGDVRPAEQLPFALPASPKLGEPPFVAVRVYAGVTHTIGGVRIDDRARVLDDGGGTIPDLYAAGADAGGIFTGGYGSGLAAALVYGRIAAESALA